MPRLTYFEPAPQGQPIGECGLVLAQLDKQPARVMRTYLVERLRAALEYLARKASTETFEEELAALADLDVARKHAGYGTVRMMVWAIPFVGSLGTVVGIGAVVANMAPMPRATCLPRSCRAWKWCSTRRHWPSRWRCC